MTLVKEDMGELLVEFKSFRKVQKVSFHCTIGTDNQQLGKHSP
jgi:hypothetical protein